MLERKYHHGELASALVDAAEAMLVSGNRSGFSLRELAKTVGVDVSACYRHFKNKDHLLNGVAGRGFRKMANEMEARIASITSSAPQDRLVETGTAYVRFALSNTAMFRVMFGQAAHHGDAIDGAGVHGDNPYQILTREISNVCKAAGLQYLETYPAIFWSFAHGVAELALSGHLPDNPLAAEELCRSSVRMLIAGMGNTNPALQS